MKLKVAVLDLYEGVANQGMRCIREILNQFGEINHIDVEVDEFEVRIEKQVPGTGYDIYISSGGPGSPLDSEGSDWEKVYFKWLAEVEAFNADQANTIKKQVFFICHSFQLACRHFNTGLVCKRRSTSFGVFPVHMLQEGHNEPVFDEMKDPFYAVDSRDYQVIQPHHEVLKDMGAKILCIEKSRPHVPYERAIMAIRFNDYMIGTQFHPEADPTGMSHHLQTEEKRKTVIDNHGEDKLRSMLEQLEDPDKIAWTYSHILPNFLNHAVGLLQEVTA